MHRSGTSALTRMINLLGVRLGDALIEAQTGVNDRGFWENREMVDLNESILGALDSAWYDYGDYPEGWWQESRFEPIRHKIGQWLRQTFEGSGVAALKDPRLCRLLPIWLDGAQQAGFQAKAIIAIRAPHEVRQSLLRRDPFSPTSCDLLGLRYLADAERLSRDLPRVIVDYHQLLDNWQLVASQIATNLDLEWPLAPRDAAPTIESEIDPTLRHQAEEDGEQHSPISSNLVELHQHMVAAIPNAPDPELLASHLGPLGEHQPCAPLVLDGNRRLAAKAEELQQTGEALAHAHQVMEEKDRGIAELDERLHALGQTHAETLKTVASRDGQLARRNQEFEQLEQWMKKLEQDLKQSGEWSRHLETELQRLESNHKRLESNHKRLESEYKRLESDLRKAGEWGLQMEAEARKNWQAYEEAAERGKQMEAEARKNWQAYEEAAASLQRVYEHPAAGRFCRLLKLHEST
jgi:hypothetical protein